MISTGSQGEPLSALRRMAHRDHPDVELHSGDTVIFSATPIPGNERSVNETIDRIFQIGAQVVTAADAPIHASGHGWQEELKLMLNLTKPRNVFPFHGDHKRLRLHADLAESVGIEPERIFNGRNGLALEIDESGATLRRGRPRQHDLRRRRLGRRARRVRAARPAQALRRRCLHRRGDDLLGRRLAGRRPRGDLPRRSLRPGRRWPARRAPGASSRPPSGRPQRTQVREISLLQQDLHDDIAEFVYEKLRRRPLVLPVVVEV